MDNSGSTPERRAWTQGPWHRADLGPRSQGTWHEEAGYSGTWNPAGDGMVLGDWTVATVAARTLARRVLKFLLLSALAGLAVVAALVALAVAVWPHAGLLTVLFVLLAVPVLLVTAGIVAAVWAGRRAWRSGAWVEAVPMVAGMPWLSRVLWAVRAALAGRALWRTRNRVRRARYQPRAGGLSGTTR